MEKRVRREKSDVERGVKEKRKKHIGKGRKKGMIVWQECLK